MPKSSIAPETKPLALFNQATYTRRQRRAVPAAPVTTELARRLTERLTALEKSLPNIVNASRDGGALQRALQGAFAKSTTVEISPLTDEQALPAQLALASADAVIGNLRLALTDDVPLELFLLKKALKPGATLLMTTFGVNSFGQLRAAFADAGLGATPHVVPLTDIASAGSLLQRLQFDRPVVDRDLVTLTFDSFDALLAALRSHGVGNFHPARQRGLCTPQQFSAVKTAYEKHRRDDGKLPLTLEVLYLHGLQPVAAAAPRKTPEMRPKIVRIASTD